MKEPKHLHKRHLNDLPKLMKTLFLTGLALLAFAGNSILCRLALQDNHGHAAIDASSFTAIRLLSGSLILFLILSWQQLRQGKQAIHSQDAKKSGSWYATLMLFIYALGFSFAYISLNTGTGALILFGAVQITMIGVSLMAGQRLSAAEIVGVAIAFAGFVYLMLPGASAPSLSGFILMAAAGVAWGLYTLAGKGSARPLHDTAFNFMRTTPFVAILLLLTISSSEISHEGVILAVLSGALASGLGYTLWYMALEKLSTVQAASLQLLVPLIATLGGAWLAGEAVEIRLIVASSLILGGIMVVIMGRARAS